MSRARSGATGAPMRADARRAGFVASWCLTRRKAPSPPRSRGSPRSTAAGNSRGPQPCRRACVARAARFRGAAGSRRCSAPGWCSTLSRSCSARGRGARVGALARRALGLFGAFLLPAKRGGRRARRYAPGSRRSYSDRDVHPPVALLPSVFARRDSAPPPPPDAVLRPHETSGPRRTLKVASDPGNRAIHRSTTALRRGNPSSRANWTPARRSLPRGERLHHRDAGPPAVGMLALRRTGVARWTRKSRSRPDRPPSQPIECGCSRAAGVPQNRAVRRAVSERVRQCLDDGFDLAVFSVGRPAS